MKISKYSMGIGDRFGHQGNAQLAAIRKAAENGILITPVWNKSFREHQIIGTIPADTRRIVDRVIIESGWESGYFVDADHIGRKTVQNFIGYCDFFTVDVAEWIGKPAREQDVAEFLDFADRFTTPFIIPGIPEKIFVSQNVVEQIAQKYIAAIVEVEKMYQYLHRECNHEFVLEMSLDETDVAQSPVELFFILAAIAWKNIPLDTIAPKFTGRFNKGVDYSGDVGQFAREFEQDILVIQFAVQEFALPPMLKLSVHSGSDKFSIYPSINKVMKKYDTGIHVKTAGTTWLEELIGLASAGGDGLQIAKEIYSQSFLRMQELIGPYVTVLDIDRSKLPAPSLVKQWNAHQFISALRHVPDEKLYNPHIRQLLHVGYKIAAELGTEYTDALIKYADYITPNVTENLYRRHIKPLFLTDSSSD